MEALAYKMYKDIKSIQKEEDRVKSEALPEINGQKQVLEDPNNSQTNYFVGAYQCQRFYPKSGNAKAGESDEDQAENKNTDSAEHQS
jgi:hypothetical protein